MQAFWDEPSSRRGLRRVVSAEGGDADGPRQGPLPSFQPRTPVLLPEACAGPWTGSVPAPAGQGISEQLPPTPALHGFPAALTPRPSSWMGSPPTAKTPEPGSPPACPAAPHGQYAPPSPKLPPPSLPSPASFFPLPPPSLGLLVSLTTCPGTLATAGPPPLL